MKNTREFADEMLRDDYVAEAGKPHVMFSPGDGLWVAFIPASDLPMGFGDNPQKALDAMLESLRRWIKGDGEWTPHGTYE